MSINFNSTYLKFAGLELPWLSMDTEELYNHNLKIKYDLLKKYGWLDTKITYKLNSHGFRCNEFSDGNNIMFLGCSNTIGIGLPLEVTWAQMVAIELRMNNVNLGLGGGAPDTAFRLCYGYIDKIKPKIVVYNEPPDGRLEIVHKSHSDRISLSNPGRYKSDLFIKDYTIEESNLVLNSVKNMLAIEMLCTKRGIKFIYLDNWYKSFSSLAQSDYARDLCHYGVMHNKAFFDTVLVRL